MTAASSHVPASMSSRGSRCAVNPYKSGSSSVAATLRLQPPACESTVNPNASTT